MKSTEKIRSALPEVGLGQRALTAGLILLIGMMLVTPNPAGIVLVPLYPQGLAKTLGVLDYSRWRGGGVAFAYLTHAACLIGVLCSNRRVAFRISAIVMGGVCVLTSYGCRNILAGVSGIH